MQRQEWLYEIRFAEATLIARNLRDYARIAVFAYWYKQTRPDRQPINCRAFRLAQSLARPA